MIKYHLENAEHLRCIALHRIFNQTVFMRKRRTLHHLLATLELAPSGTTLAVQPLIGRTKLMEDLCSATLPLCKW
jgi:hypothetical protein